MKLDLICCWFVALSGTFSFACLGAEQPLPRWLAVEDRVTQTWQLSKPFDLDESVLSAQLKLLVDFARVSVKLNDVGVFALEPYCQLQTIDVTQSLKLGKNWLHVDVECVEGPSAIALEIEVRLQSGRTLRVLTDETWTAQVGARPLKLRVSEQLKPEMFGSNRRDISLSPIENYEQWRQASSEDAQVQPKFWTVAGFEITLLRTAAADEGSWISLAFDPDGKAVVSREDRGLLRLTLDPDKKTVHRVEVIDVDLEECRGLEFHDDWLYANANNSKGLFRLKISNSGRAEELQCLRKFAGTVGHGRNDITIDKDWLYSIHGDSVDLPVENVTDLTSPLRHATADGLRREGHLLRMHLPTGKWEVLCGGLRNPYGITAHPSGELFTFDADNEFDMGTPWYRPTRVIGLFQGGDYGYRTAGDKLPPRFHDQPDNAPPVLTIGRSSPTAVLYDNKLDFPKPYRDALFLLDWTYGRVLAVHLAPLGAGWRAQAELFLQGRPLNVTDVARGRDGAMYLITGGRKTQSSLYRVAAVAEPLQATLKATASEDSHATAVEKFALDQRAKRTQLEAIARHCDVGGLDIVLDALANADPVIRLSARIAVERMPRDKWSNAVLEAKNQTGSLYGLLAYAHAMEPGDVPRLMERWLACELSQCDLSQKLVWVRLCELMLGADGELGQRYGAPVSRKLLSAWPEMSVSQVASEGTTTQLRQRLAQLMGHFKMTDGVTLISRDLLSSTSQEDQLAGLLAMRHQRQGWTMDQRRQQFSHLQQSGSMIGGQGLPGFLTSIKADSLATLSDSEKQSLKEILEPPSTTIVFEELASRTFVRKWQSSDFVELTNPTIVGDRQRGSKLFRETMCVRCHRMGNKGSAIGPDLTYVGRRFNRRDLIESIIDPSHSVAENYRLDLIATKSGNIHTGQILVTGDYRLEKIRMQTDPLRADAVIEFDKREIEEHRQLDRSPMPDGLLDTCTQAEVYDLLAYLQNP